MKLLSLTIYLSCFMMSYANPESRLNKYCYDPPGPSCTEHILGCGDEQVISTDISNWRVCFFKNTNFPACQTGEDVCRNDITCCKYINESITVQGQCLSEDNKSSLINFIKTECSSKSSCSVGSSCYYSPIDSWDKYDFITYNYSCIPPSKDEITVNFLVNESTEFTGNIFQTIYFLDYTGNETKDNDVILNRECIVTTTDKDIFLTIKTLNFQAGDCCRFNISRYNVSEYCSQSGSSTPSTGKHIGKNTAIIRLENVVNKEGGSFSILVRAAGNVTIDCREIEHDDKEEPIKCQYPTPESSTISSSYMPSTNSVGTILPDKETYLAGIMGGAAGGLVVPVVIIIVIVVIMRRRRRPTDNVNEHDNYNTIDDNVKDNPKDDPKDNSGYIYIDINLDKVSYKINPNNGANKIKSSNGKDSEYSETKIVPDTNKHIGVNNSVDKGDNSDLDTYNHIGTNNDNPVANRANLDLDTYNHIGTYNDSFGSKGEREEVHTYDHIGINNSVAKGDDSDLDPYNHIGVNNSAVKGDDPDLDTYDHIQFKNDKRDCSINRDSDNYNHIYF